ncbi:capsular polysaccharide synthesis protein [Microbacterium hibisci]|uniref:capsular polysaccharide synthesis protein n=1 Tax=Microbacterium hibisci TaxID=2036000 RepID=UPI001944EA7B|nr:capsular polysaccharide synthesis protein [Microbacterium hibisci]
MSTGIPNPFEGLEAQLRRADRFRDTVDPVAAIAASRTFADFLRPRLPGLRVAAGLPAEAGSRKDGRLIADRDGARVDPAALRLYTFWNTPLETAPPLVQACIAELTRLHADGPTPLTVLDGASARELVEIPDAAADALEKDHPAHFSDFVRVSVLDRLGGIWVDATCWAPAPLPDAVAPLLTAGALYPRWTRHQIGNWFIAAVPSTPLIRLQRLALEAWWESGGGLPDYFLYHRIFEVLLELVPEFHGQWDAAPTLSSAASHLLQLGMMQPWDADAMRFVAGASIVQKLSYKYDAVPQGSVLDRLVTGAALLA